MPYEVVYSKLSSLQITDVRPEDLSYFKNLVQIDLSDNLLSLE